MSNERVKELAANIAKLCDGYDNFQTAQACGMIAGLALKAIPNEKLREDSIMNLMDIIMRAAR